MFKICFLDDFYYANQTADTIFYIDINGQCFPDYQWTDFAISVLHMWNSTIITNYKNNNAKFELCYLDGPYFISCLKQGSKVHMTCIEDKQHKVTVCESDEDIEVIINELIDASTSIIKTVKNHNFGQLEDLEKLKQSLELLKKL